MAELSSQVVSAIAADPSLDALFREGKMLGILIHSKGWELAYSGKRSDLAVGVQMPQRIFKCFVPPVYDVTVGPFREKEEEIGAMNRAVDEAVASAAPEEEISQLRLARAMESVKLQKWTFGQYVLCNARGERKSVLDIFAQKGILPPAAAGDCAAPKLLQYAYLNGLEPLEIGEFWYGRSPFGPVRAQGRFYPACSWKCGPLLGFMLEGLGLGSAVAPHGEPRILFEDESIVVVDKPSGMPAVPGLDGLLSLETWLASRIPSVFQVHRLDQDTSGLMVFAKSRRAQVALQRQFEERQVRKEYVAIVCVPGTSASGTAMPSEGVIDLPLGPDHEDKPRQKVDAVQGKPAVTEYRLAEGAEAVRIFRHFGLAAPCGPSQSAEGGLRAVVFHPLTGRSHQLRVHAAHAQGLASPILGDTLYGGASGTPCSEAGGPPVTRLCLHASRLSFCHPLTGESIIVR